MNENVAQLENDTFSRSKEEIRKTVDYAVYGAADRQSNWSEMLADAMLDKRHHRLAEFISHGKGFNDSSKQAFCKLLGVKPMFKQKEIDALIAHHCSIDLETLMLERKLYSAKATERHAKHQLDASFGNAEELVSWVKSLVENDYSTLFIQGNKSYLINGEGNGYPLKRTLIRKYAEALIQVCELNGKLA